MKKIQKSDAEWKQELPHDVYHIMREKGTEHPFSGKYYHHTEIGTYMCAACGNQLFNSRTKFDSGSGWPSFFKPISEDAVESETDASHGTVRSEVHCSRCDGHLGHVFTDGPPPTGLRYCINSKSLKFQKQDTPPPV
jgi:peptide-methionine (R)-S-oxide reductase